VLPVEQVTATVAGYSLDARAFLNALRDAVLLYKVFYHQVQAFAR
jgi:hypothetical protein